MVSDTFKGIAPPCNSIGRWLPKDRGYIKQWLAHKIKELEEDKYIRIDPSVFALQELVATTPYLKKLSQDMFIQIPPAYVNDPTGEPQVRDFDLMLGLVNKIIRSCPPWFNKDDPDAMGMIGFPINAVLDWPMGTMAGHHFFFDGRVNIALQAILNTWGQFLQSKDSLESFSDWLSDEALQILADKADDTNKLNFSDIYECSPSLPHYGFGSWDDFFTRKFKSGIRPVEYPDTEIYDDGTDPTLVVLNACESAPLQLATQVKLSDIFWLKNQPYSLQDMFDNDGRAKQFVGGSVYQAFLSATSYHCWHAPVSGMVVDILTIPGTYYSENIDQGFDPGAPNNSQPYISSVAARAIIFIEAKNPVIGLMAIVFIGMAEVSSCKFQVKAGDVLTKGQLIGEFHFGGSSHCMLFRPSTNLQPENFIQQPPWGSNDRNNMVGHALAMVTPQSAK